jgi:signal recognition particle subunit SRP68
LASAFADEVKEIYLQRVADLAPNIRYCEYNIGDDSAIEDLRAMRLKGGQQDEWIQSLDVC